MRLFKELREPSPLRDEAPMALLVLAAILFALLAFAPESERITDDVQGTYHAD